MFAPVFVSSSSLYTTGFGVATLALVVMARVAPAGAQRAPDVDVWFDHGNDFDPGQSGELRYRGNSGSYVTIARINTDGQMSILLPRDPNIRSRANDSRDGVPVPFTADPSEGVGYIFAISSRSPFDFRAYRARNGWDMGSLAQRVGVDPFQAVDRFARNITGRPGEYAITYAPYEIGRGGAGRAAYRHGVTFDPDDSYGGYGAYGDPWGASPYRGDYSGNVYYGSGYSGAFRDGYSRNGYSRNGYSRNGYPGRARDPRTMYNRHCADGTLVPYTQPCRNSFPPPTIVGRRPVDNSGTGFRDSGGNSDRNRSGDNRDQARRGHPGGNPRGTPAPASPREPGQPSRRP